MIKQHNFIYLEAAMKNKVVVRLVERASETIWYRLPDVTSFEHTCYINIGKELMRKEVTSVAAMATHYINRAAARHLNRSKYEPPKSFGELEENNDRGEKDSMYEVEDVLVNVEEDFVYSEHKKKVTDLLVQDDYLKRLILNAWQNGFTNTSELSSILVDTYGEKSFAAYRKCIQRFKIECEKLVA